MKAVTASSAQPPQQAKAVVRRQCACGNHTSSGGECDSCAKKKLQRKLSVGASNDPLELEADRVADQVLTNERTSHSFFSLPSIRPSSDISPNPVTPTAGQDATPASVAQVLASSGSPLPIKLRRDMERRFGEDFSQVRIHTDVAADKSARDINARAYTQGNNIVFAQGQFSPESRAGKHLLAHELTHVVQQSAQVRRDIIDPLEQMAGVTSSSVHTILIDPSSRRARFYTRGGQSMDGHMVEKSSSFADGEYLLRKSDKKDPLRTWDIFTTDGKKYYGGLQFSVVLDLGEKGSTVIDYTPDIKLRVQSGVLPKLIDIKARVAAIRKQVEKKLVNDEEETDILKLLQDIPPEQADDFIKLLRSEKVGDRSLIEQLDKDVDGDNNIALHQALSKLKLQSNAAKSAASLVDAPMLAWHDVMGFFEQKAVFSVTRTDNGKIRIRYLGGVASGLFSNPEYTELKNMSRKDRLNIMTGYGIEVDADQPIIIHDYDSDRNIVLTAEDLIAYQHAGVRKFIQDMGTIASLATPVGAETAGARVLAYGVQIASVATLIVDENKLNIRKWFPNWGPAIIATSEKIKLGLAIIGIAQLVQNGWKLFTALRQLRSSRAAMDAKAVVTNADEALRAESQAARLESNADTLLSQAQQARKELGLTDEVVDVTALGKNTENAAAATNEAAKLGSASAKTKVIDEAIKTKNYTGDFGALANRELSANAHKMRASKMPGYSVEVPIEGTEHFLARKPNGTWCLFSSDPKGCGAISVAATLDKTFGDAAREVEKARAVPKNRVPFANDPDFAESIRDAERAPGVDVPRSDKSTSDLGNLSSKRGSPYVKGLHSADLGVAEGKAKAAQDGLKHVFDNPKGMEHNVTGLDSIYRDKKTGALVIVEFKGGDAKLAPRQMTSEWVGKKIAELEKNPQLKDLPLVKELRKAYDGKKLQGRTYSTPLNQTTGEVLDTVMQNHGVY